MSRLDGKFHGTLVKNKNGAEVPEDEWMVFLAKDNAVPATLRFYRSECERIGAEAAQLEAIDGLIRRVDWWRADHRDQCKVPDLEPGEHRLS